MLGTVYKKELLDAFRDRKIVFLTILIPLLLNMGAVIFFEYFLFSSDKEAAYTVTISKNTDAVLIDYLSKQDQLIIEKSSNPIAVAKAGDAQVALITSDDFSESIKNEKTTTITLYSEAISKTGGEALMLVNDALHQYSNQLVQTRLDGKGVSVETIQPFAIVEKPLTNENNEMQAVYYLLSLFFPLIMVTAVMSGGLPAATEYFAGEKEKKTIESLLITPVKRTTIVVAKWLAIATISVITVTISLGTFFIAIQLFTKEFAKALDGAPLLHLFFSTLVASVLFSLLTAAILTIASMLSQSFKEMQSYSSPLFMLVLIPYYALLTKAPTELTTTYFLIPFVNIFALFKELSYGIFSFSHLFLTCLSLGVFVFILFFVMLKMFKQDRWLIPKS